MKFLFRNLATLLGLCLCMAVVHAQDLRSAMETANTQWLTAFNTNKPADFTNLYAKDAILMPPGLKPITGAKEISAFWESRLKPGNKKDHTFEIISTAQDGKLAYQINRWTVRLIKDNGDSSVVAGNSTRIFEHQADGSWQVKLHIYTFDQ